MTESHVVEVRRNVTVCLTCGQVAKARDALVHLVDTYLGRWAS